MTTVGLCLCLPHLVAEVVGGVRLIALEVRLCHFHPHVRLLRVGIHLFFFCLFVFFPSPIPFPRTQDKNTINTKRWETGEEKKKEKKNDDWGRKLGFDVGIHLYFSKVFFVRRSLIPPRNKTARYTDNHSNGATGYPNIVTTFVNSVVFFLYLLFPSWTWRRLRAFMNHRFQPLKQGPLVAKSGYPPPIVGTRLYLDTQTWRQAWTVRFILMFQTSLRRPKG